ncbi:MAG TPA: lyase family protein [Kofleriaceae bacterium]|nr:lyase family protein [Kofleriaceae bacterium]
MPPAITARMASTPEMLACFDDDALLRGALAFERELAAALADCGAISAPAAAAISAACERFDPTGLDDAAAHAGTLAIPLVARLRAQVPPEHAGAVHLGATSQDVADTALALQIARAMWLLDHELDALADALAALARGHATLPALGRTLVQPAALITFGMRAANWLLGIEAAHARLAREARGAAQVQLGGPVGSLSGLGPAGPAVREALAERLGLAPGLAWHSRRDGIAGLGAAIGIAIGATGKLARDVSLLMQTELAEVAEPAIAGRGGSSAMPHKRNPTGCQVALSAAIRAPGLVASLLAGMPQELERGLGGWQAEAPVIGELFALAHGAARAMRVVAEGLEVDAAAISAHALAAPHAQADRDVAIPAAARFVDEALANHDAQVARRADRRASTDPQRG